MLINEHIISASSDQARNFLQFHNLAPPPLVIYHYVDQTVMEQVLENGLERLEHIEDILHCILQRGSRPYSGYFSAISCACFIVCESIYILVKFCGSDPASTSFTMLDFPFTPRNVPQSYIL